MHQGLEAGLGVCLTAQSLDLLAFSEGRQDGSAPTQRIRAQVMIGLRGAQNPLVAGIAVDHHAPANVRDESHQWQQNRVGHVEHAWRAQAHACTNHRKRL